MSAAPNATRRLLLPVALIVGVLVVAGAAFYVGHLGGPNLAMARAAGARTGELEGRVAGYAQGYAAGRAAGKRQGRTRAYAAAYQVAYDKAAGR